MIKYIVNKEKRTIAAVIEFEPEEPCFKNSRWIYSNIYDVWALLNHIGDKYTKKYHNESRKMYFPKYMSAKAKCDPQDEWDEEYGKKLARERLMEKIHNYRNNAYNIINKYAEKIYNLSR